MLDRGIAYIALGSNLGRREQFLADGRRAVEAIPDTVVLAATPVEETAPLGGMEQGLYLNQMLAVETALGPRMLLRELQAIEARAGRQRAERWAPRTLDLDIVIFEGVNLNDPDLMLPHPELPNREFWQRELGLLRGIAK